MNLRNIVTAVTLLISSVSNVYAQVVDDPEALFMGFMQTWSGDVKEQATDERWAKSIPKGLFVTFVAEGGPAEGLQSGDVIIRINGLTLATKQKVEDVKERLEVGKPADVVASRYENGRWKNIKGKITPSTWKSYCLDVVAVSTDGFDGSSTVWHKHARKSVADPTGIELYFIGKSLSPHLRIRSRSSELLSVRSASIKIDGKIVEISERQDFNFEYAGDWRCEWCDIPVSPEFLRAVEDAKSIQVRLNCRNNFVSDFTVGEDELMRMKVMLAAKSFASSK